MPVPTLETLFPGIKAGGAALPPAIATRLYELEVVSTYNEPDQCTLVFDLDANENIPTAFEIGKEVEVSFRAERAQEVVFKGEITAMNFNGSNLRTMYVIECQDKFHRFFRDDKTRTFLKRSISDVAQTMAGEHGVTAEVSSTQTKYDFLMQQNVSNGEWLLEQAAKRNYHARVTDGKLVFKKVGAAGDSNVVLEWGANLISFNARVTGSVSLKEATVRGWDPKQKKDITGQASAPTATVDPAVKQA
jgi:hypothetical protein